jgi:hypothetical protein
LRRLVLRLAPDRPVDLPFSAAGGVETAGVQSADSAPLVAEQVS